MNKRLRRLFCTTLAATLLLSCNPAKAAEGHMPDLVSEDLNGDEIKLPQGLPGDRTIIFMAFAHEQRLKIAEWITGMHLTGAIPWVEMPVIDNPGAVVRLFIRTGMRSGITDQTMRSHVVPVFTDKAAFLQSLGITDQNAVYALVVDHQGHVLSMVHGDYTVHGEAMLTAALHSPLKNL